MISHIYRNHFLSIDKTRAYIDTEILSLKGLMRNIPSMKEDTNLKKGLTKGKYKDKGQRFDMSKVQMELICYGYNAHQCVYSNKMAGGKGILTKSDVGELQKWSEGGYMCGSKLPGDKFYVRGKLFCGNYIDSKYYYHLGGKKANNSSKDVPRVPAKGKMHAQIHRGNICAIYYSFQDFLLGAEIKRIHNIGGKNTLLI